MQKQQRFVADQRFDLPQYESMMDLISAEFNAYNKSFITDTNYIVKNWKIEDGGGLVVKVNNTAESLLINSERTGKEGIQYRPSLMTLLTKTLEDNATNYVEVEITTQTTGSDAVAIWDTAANSGQGEEFIQNVDTVQCEEPALVSNTVAFSVGQPQRIRLATVVTAAGSIVSITDARKFLYKLYTDWNFGVTRTDETIGSLKSNDDAIKTILKEMKGTTNWYDQQTLSVENIIERMNYILVDGGNVSWNLPKPARGSLIAERGDPNNGIKDGDTFTISDGVTAVTFEFDTNSSVSGGNTPVTITTNMVVASVKSAIVAAINAHAFNVTASPGSSNRIDLVNDANGTAGNVTITEVMANASSQGVSLSPEGMSGGFSATSLIWTAALRVIAPSRAFAYTISAQTIANLADGEVVYVTLPTEGVAPGGPLSTSKVASSAYVINPTNTRNYIIAYRSGSKIYFGNGWQSVELEDGETSQLGDGISNEWLIATGLTSEYDSTPPYTSAFWVTPGTSFTQAISELDTISEAVWNLVTGKIYDELLISDGSPTYAALAFVTLPAPFGIGAPQTYQTGFNQLEVYFNGRKTTQGVGQDWVEDANVGAGIGNRIQLLYALPLDTKITFRIQTGGGQAGSVGSNAPDVYDEGSLVESQVGQINFVGPMVRATSPAPGQVDVTFRYPRELARLCKNMTGSSIAAGKVVAWLNDGTIQLADANISTLSDFVGVTAEIIPDGAFGTVIRAGACPGAVTGLGATIGAPVFLSGTPGELTLTAPSGISDTVVRMGRAEPADGVASPTATDLWLQPEVIAEP